MFDGWRNSLLAEQRRAQPGVLPSPIPAPERDRGLGIPSAALLELGLWDGLRDQRWLRAGCASPPLLPERFCACWGPLCSRLRRGVRCDPDFPGPGMTTCGSQRRAEPRPRRPPRPPAAPGHLPSAAPAAGGRRGRWCCGTGVSGSWGEREVLSPAIVGVSRTPSWSLSSLSVALPKSCSCSAP